MASGRDLPVRTIPPGEPVPGLPEMASQLLAALDAYDSPIDITELADTYGVTPTTVADFISEAVAASAAAARAGA